MLFLYFLSITLEELPPKQDRSHIDAVVGVWCVHEHHYDDDNGGSEFV